MEEKNIKQKLDDILGETGNATGALDLIAEGIYATSDNDTAAGAIHLVTSHIKDNIYRVLSDLVWNNKDALSEKKGE
ncbi:MAG: hypothetical protein IJT80_02055 [Lachnospiraceae bacterium]|nr:hypothetical protein [Lachnospiraceae bacterium]